jgi:hypothetical protein
MTDVRVAEIRQLIDGLRWDRRRHPYHGRREYSQRARAVAAAIEGMIEAGDAASAGPLARRAVERVTAALLYMDDSAGIAGDDLRALMSLYARACRAEPPDPRRLAAWLASRQLDGPGWPAIRRYVTELTLERAGDKYRYPKAIKTIRRLHDAYRRTGDDAGFAAYVADLRQRHRRKTSFITKLDKALAAR